MIKDYVIMFFFIDVLFYKCCLLFLYDFFIVLVVEGSKFDCMIEVFEKQKKCFFIEMDVFEFFLEVEWDEEDEVEDLYLDESYYFGDMEDFEMDYRFVLQRIVVKKDIRDFINSLSLLRDGSIYGIFYKVVD